MHYAFVGTLALQRARKFLYLRTPNGAFPFFGLNINHVKTQFVFLDDAVDAAIPAAPDRTPSILSRSTVSHRDELIDHEALKECWRRGLDLLE